MRGATIQLHAKRIVALLWIALVTIVALAVLREVYVAAFGAETVLKKLGLLTLTEESSLCGWYSSLLLAGIAGLLLISGHADDRPRWKPYWNILAAIFVFLSFDEAVALHERWVTLSALPSYKIFGAQWVIPYTIFFLLVGFAFLRFVLAQPEPLRRLIFLAAAIYVGSAVGLEMVESYCARASAMNCYLLSATIQEVGEMIGLTIFAAALVASLGRRQPPISVTLH